MQFDIYYAPSKKILNETRSRLENQLDLTLVYLRLEKYRSALTDLRRFSVVNKDYIVNDPSVAAFLYYKLHKLDSACSVYQKAQQYK